MEVVAPERRSVAAPPSTEEIDVVLSDCVEDVDDAIAIVHDGFVEAGYSAPQASGRRLHPAYLNPGTFFAVARVGGEAIGTIALIADGPFGLPSDRAFAEENDLLRAESDAPIRECGSLAVRASWRRHTRRIFMRTTSALLRVGLEEFPDAPVPMVVAPESERFYSAMTGAHLVAGPRPLYGAPAVLMRTSAAGSARHCSLRNAPGQRRMNALVAERNPSWLMDRRSGEPLPSEWLRELIDEQGVMDRLGAQVGLLARRHPDTLLDLLRDARGVTTA